jgi:hypothetical protein
MPEIIETTVYQFEELSDTAKEKARAWYREGAYDHDWHDFIFEDFVVICTILGITLKTRPVKLMGGGTRADPCIWFRGFYAQGDGACFEGTYAHAKGAASAIRAHAPQDVKLHQIADTLSAVQRRNFYQLQADIRHSGHYTHEYCMVISVERDSPTAQGMTKDAEDIVTETLRDLARWLYRQLEREYEYQTSDAVIDETIAANAYTFMASGRRFG